MTKELMAAALAQLPVLGIQGIPDRLTHFELIVDAEDVVRVKCEFLVEKDTWASIEEKWRPVLSEYILVPNGPSEALANTNQGATKAAAQGV